MIDSSTCVFSPMEAVRATKAERWKKRKIKMLAGWLAGDVLTRPHTGKASTPIFFPWSSQKPKAHTSKPPSSLFFFFFSSLSIISQHHHHHQHTSLFLP